MELSWRETLYTSSIKDLLRVFSEKLSIKRTFLREQCLLSYLVPVFAVSFNLVLFAEQVSTLWPPVSQMTSSVKTSHSRLSLTNQWRPLSKSAVWNQYRVVPSRILFFPRVQWKTAFSGSLKLRSKPAAGGSRVCDNLARPGFDQKFLMPIFRVIKRGKRSEMHDIDSSICQPPRAFKEKVLNSWC